MAKIYAPPGAEKYGNKAENLVLQALGNALAERHSSAIFAQFPVATTHLRVADLVILDRGLGLTVIEVKGLLISQITAVAGDCWKVRGYFGRSEIYPHQQARGALDLLLENTPGSRPPARVAVALPYISRAAWQRAGFRLCASLLFQDDLGASFLEQLQRVPAMGVARADEHWFEHWQCCLAGQRIGEGAPSLTKRELIERVLVPYVQTKDLQLRGEAIDVPSGVFRVRGVAGAGKTTLLGQSAAWMHFCEPQAHIGFVYHTRSLFEQCFALVRESLEKLAASRGARVLADATIGRIALEGATGAIRIFNSWGGAKSGLGFYSFMCGRLGVPARTMSEAQGAYLRRFGRPPESAELLPFLCLELLETHGERLRPCLDALFIDEAQDLIVGSSHLLYGGDREPFFWLAYEALRAVNAERPEQRRLVFAYDEAQSLSTLHIPSAKQLFGESLARLFQGGRGRNRILRCSYRNPKPILIAAHALGMGFLRSGGAVQGLRGEEWRAIGYEVNTGFRAGQFASILREDEQSPNPVPKHWREDAASFIAFDNAAEEIEALRRALLTDLHEHQLSPSRDILVIDLRRRWRQLQTILERPAPDGSTSLRCHVPAESPDRNVFWKPGCITVADIWRAKGNEAPMVYVLGLDALKEENGSDLATIIRTRNSFFVALTRAQAWCALSGVRNGPATAALFDEIRSVLGMVQSSGSALQFTYRQDRRFRELAHEEQMELIVS